MSNNPPPPDQPVRRKTKKKSPKKALAATVGVLVIAILAIVAFYGAYFYRHLGKQGQRLFIAAASHPTVSDQFPGTSSLNLMIIGRDYDYTNQDVVMKTSARADLLMMAKLDFANNQVKILSIPRDSKAVIPGFPDSKINSAEEKGGPKLTAATVLTNYNIPEDKYVALDFDGFQKAIDELGGVDLTVDKKMDYDDNWGFLHIHLKPGYQHLDGYNAMGFVRFRHSDSDIVRTKRQQALLAALKVKLDEPQTFVILPNLINIMNDSSDTDLTDKQKVALAFWLHGVPKSNFDMQTVPVVEGGYYVYTDWPKAAPLIKTFFGVDPPAGTSMVTPLVADQPRHRHHHHVVIPA